VDRKTVETLLAAGGGGSEPKTVIYTSGVWANGDTKCASVDETSPAAPIQAVSFRPATEALVLGSTAKGIVIRPGVVYGGRGGLTGMWFGGALSKSVKVIGDGKNHMPPVHVDDLADSYVRAAESGLKGELFLLADASTATAKQMATAAARAAGYQGEVELWPVAEAAKAMGSWVEGLGLDQHVDSGKARRLLGWEPKHRSFVEEASTYFETWKEHQAAAAVGAAG
jgi:nucleoside-diphosphate-sugar epimerase